MSELNINAAATKATAILIGQRFGVLPPPLDDWQRGGLLAILQVTSIHAAAAMLVSGSAAAVLINPEELPAADARMVRALVRSARVPVMLLPGEGTLRNAEAIRGSGALTWAQAGPALEAIVHGRGAAAVMEVAELRTDKAEGSNTEIADENAVTSLIAARYDEVDHHPVLSEEEMQALLGMAE